MFELWNEEPEAFYRAASADPRHDRVAMRADLLVAAILQICAAVEIERWAAFVELCANPASARQDKVDLFVARQRNAPDCSGRNAFRALFLFPVELRGNWVRLDRDAQDDLVLDHQARDIRRVWLPGENAEQHR